MRVIRIKHSSPGFVNTLDEKLREGVTLVVTQAAKQRDRVERSQACRRLGGLAG